MNTIVARQPILDVHQAVYGYELLFRCGPENFFPEFDPETSTIPGYGALFSGACGA